MVNESNILKRYKMRKIKGKICKNENIHLYHISEDNHDRKMFKPRIPASTLEEENRTKQKSTL